MPWPQALFAPASGYLNLIGNAAGLLSRTAVSVRYAPFITLAVSLGTQLVPCLILVTSRDAWLRRRWVLLLALAALIVPPAAEEVWLNTANAQFHLLLAAALILALDAPVGVAAYGRAGVLFVSALCGPGAIALLPLCLTRLWSQPPARRLQALALGAGLALQFGFFLHASTGRGLDGGFDALLGAVYIKQILIPLLGPDTGGLAHGIAVSVGAGRIPLDAVACVTVLCGWLAWVAGSAVTAPRRTTFWLLAAAASLIACYLGALGGPVVLLDDLGGQRYSFAPQALITLALLAAGTGSAGYVRWMALAAAVWMISVGVWYFPQSRLSGFDTGPDWAAEVDLWHGDPNHALRIWPDGWFVRLPVKHP